MQGLSFASINAKNEDFFLSEHCCCVLQIEQVSDNFWRILELVTNKAFLVTRTQGNGWVV